MSDRSILNQKSVFGIISLFLTTGILFSFPGISGFSDRYKTWLEEEVFYIITSKEKDVFLKLTSDRERDIFIEAFWKQRDPTKGTETNEFKDEHYRRLNHVNRMFRGTGKPGWKTDRGKVYILLGEPLSTRSFMGRDDYYPVEMWNYQGLEGSNLPQAFHILFYQKGRIGDYIFYNPGLEGPWTLMPSYQGDMGNIYDSFRHLEIVEPELAQAALSLVPSEKAMNQYSMASAVLLQNIDVYATRKIEDKYALKFMEYKDVIDVEYTANWMDNQSTVKVFQDDQGTSYVHLSIEPDAISMGEYEGRISTQLEFNGLVSDETGRVLYQFDKTVSLRFDREQYQKMSRRPFNFYHTFPLIPGRYRFSLLLKNTVSKEFTSLERQLLIPDNQENLSLSELLLAFNAQRISATSPGVRAFSTDDLQLYNQPHNIFIPADVMRVFFQLHPAGHEIRRQGKIKYAFLLEDREFAVLEYPLVRYRGQVNVLETFPLKDFPPGYYTLAVTLLDSGGREAASRREPFIISPRDYLPRPWVRSESSVNRGDFERDYILGLQWLNKDVLPVAQKLLRRAYEAASERGDYAFALARVEWRMSNFAEALRLLEAHEDIGQNGLDRLLMIGRCQLSLARPQDALATFKQAAQSFGSTVEILNGLGDSYAALGDAKQALALWEKSLSLNSDQPDVRERLRSLQKK